MLSEPRPLVEKGKYNLDNEIYWLRKKRTKNKRNINLKPNDAISWFESYQEEQKKNDKEKENRVEAGPHNCFPGPKGNRCALCGAIIEKNFYYLIDFPTTYFSYTDPIINTEEIRGTLYQTIQKPTNNHEMRAYLLTIMGTNLKSLNEIYQKRKKIPACLTKYLTIRNQKEYRRDELLKFDSNFESGNLSKVYCVEEDEYDLFLSVDTNTKGYTQWFSFSVSCTEAPGKVVFNIKNCCKWDSGFGHGMPISIFSTKEHELNKTGWTFGGEDIKYFQNNLKREVFTMQPKGSARNLDESEDELDEEFAKETIKKQREEKKREKEEDPNNTTIQVNGKGVNESMTLESKQPNVKKRKFYYYTLSFTYNFQHDNDKVYFAYMRPYTYTDLINLFTKSEKKLLKEDSTSHSKSSLSHFDKNDFGNFKPLEIITPDIIYRRERICTTISGIPLYMITITGNADPQTIKKRKGIFLTARVHPGEANSSYVMQGIIKYLLDDNKYAKSLRNFYVFKIVPMLNPEGVAVGNNRTGTAGADLNRRWAEPNEKLHPTIYYTKQALAEFKKEREILIFCDIHGHSMKKNAFIYGCNTAADGGFCSWTKVRLFPRIFARKTHVFSLSDCTFRVTPDRIGTARVTVWREFKITNSFTLEVSLWGYDYGEQVIPFTDESLEQLGRDFLLSLLEYTYVWAELTREFILTGGWLKPSKLIEVTGTPAQKVLDRQLKEEKEEKRKQEIRDKLKKLKAKETKRTRNKTIRLAGMKQNNSLNGSLLNSSLQPKKGTDKEEAARRNGYSDDDRFSDGNLCDHGSDLDNLHNFTTESERDLNMSKEFETTRNPNDSIDRGELSFIENVIVADKNLKEILPQVKEDWREYFKGEELNANYELIMSGKDPDAVEKESDEIVKNDDNADTGSDISDLELEKEPDNQDQLQSNDRKVSKKEFIIKTNNFRSISNSKQSQPQKEASVNIGSSVGSRPPLPMLNLKNKTPSRQYRNKNDSVETSLEQSFTTHLDSRKENNKDLLKGEILNLIRKQKAIPRGILQGFKSPARDKVLDQLLVIKPNSESTKSPSREKNHKEVWEHSRRNLSDSVRIEEPFSPPRRGEPVSSLGLGKEVKFGLIHREINKIKYEGSELLKRRRGACNDISNPESLNNSISHSNGSVIIWKKNEYRNHDARGDSKIISPEELRYALKPLQKFAEQSENLAQFGRKVFSRLKAKKNFNVL